MQISVTFDPAAVFKMADALESLGPKLRRVEVESLNEGGDLIRTEVRQALKHQMNVKRYGAITAHTRTSRASAGSLAYTIYGTGPGLPITDFPVTGGGKGGQRTWRQQPRDGHGRFGSLPDNEAGRVVAQSWGVAHRFKRSFVDPAKGYAARLPDSRAVRKLFGPSVGKEIVKGETAATFEGRAAQTVERILFKRAGRLLP